MRKVILLSVFSMFVLHSRGQQVALSDTVSIKLPPGIEKLGRDEFSSTIKSKFGQSAIALNSIPNPHERLYNKHYYKIGDIIVSLIYGKRPTPIQNDYLLKLKRSLDITNNTPEKNPTYLSSIEKINENDVLIIYTVYDNIGYYRFYCNDTTNVFALNGVLQFNTTEKDKAQTIMNDLLESVKFTNH